MTEQQQPTAANPLAEARIDSIDELFSRDPEGYCLGPDGTPATGADMQNIIAGLRRQRQVWERAEAEGAKRAPSPKVKTAKPQVSLADLGLDDET
jgi:hypothetical protein